MLDLAAGQAVQEVTAVWERIQMAAVGLVGLVEAGLAEPEALPQERPLPLRQMAETVLNGIRHTDLAVAVVAGPTQIFTVVAVETMVVVVVEVVEMMAEAALQASLSSPSPTNPRAV
jgi:hypothetical protein